MLAPWKKSYDQPRQHIKKQRHYFANKGSSSQGCGFPSSHVRMWELDYKEHWAPKNWCFWTVVLDKTLERPLDCKEIQLVHSKGDQSWVFFGRTGAKAETPINTLATSCEELTHWKRLWCWEGLGQEEKGMTEDKMVEWHHWLDGREFGWTPGVGDGQGGLGCCNLWDRRVGHDWATELNWTEEIDKLHIDVAVFILIQDSHSPL